MSVAFVREPNELQAAESLPDREIGSEPNFVTARGLGLIESELVRLREAIESAMAADDKQAVATLGRDLRYWSARRSSAEIVEAPDSADAVHFGNRVTIERDDGRRQTFQIVGQDEADPSKGLISYLAPLARSLAGKRVGDVVTAGPGEAEIVAIEA